MSKDQKSSGETVAGSQQDASTPPAIEKPIPTVSSARRRLLDLAGEWERAGERDESLVYTSPLWARLTLPHSNPGDVPHWVSRNGSFALTVQPGTTFDEEGKVVSTGFPYGIIPRHLMVYIATQATLTKEPIIDLGDSFHAFVRRLGLKDGRSLRRRATQQMRATAGAHISVHEYGKNETGWGSRVQNVRVFDSLDLWINGEATQPGLWGSSLHLSPEFFETIVSSPMPVFAADLKALGGSSLRHDVYLWLVYRLHALSSTTRITWSSLHEQMGSNYALERQFRAKFLEALRDVLVLYPQARVDPTPTQLVLRPSPAQVSPAKRD